MAAIATFAFSLGPMTLRCLAMNLSFDSRTMHSQEATRKNASKSTLARGTGIGD
jgi:hypothetical protein